MKRSFLNIIVDAVSLIVFLSMFSTGFLLKFVLPPGSGRVERFFQGGRRYEKTIDLYWGLTRHEWGAVHFVIALIFLGLLTIHLVLHWKWIKAMTIGTKDSPQPLRRKVVTIIVVVVMVIILILPWLGKKKTLSRAEFFQLKKIQEIHH